MPEDLRPREKLLLSLERSPWNAAYRIAVGFLLVFSFVQWFGRDVSFWPLFLYFLIVLLLLRLIPAVFRRFLPLSRAVKAIWFEQRQLAKRYDSYQWRKLFWIGVGMAAYMLFIDQHLGRVWSVLIIGCLVAGSLGILIWRTVRVPSSPPNPGRPLQG